MPISAENMSKYPGGSIKSKEWEAIKAFVRARSGDRCEKCGVRNHAFGWRDDEGGFHEEGDPRGPHKLLTNQGVKKLFLIVCTTAHVDNDLIDHSTTNLAFWCQQCHLRHDAKQHAAASALTRQAKVGQGALF